MSFDSATLNRLAKLAHLRIAPDELPSLGNEMSAIFSLIDQLQAVDTKGIAPLSHPLSAIEDMTLRLRDDIAVPCDRDANLANAPETENGLFLVPKVIE
jgi:aspartyl-tRNA(Asn)/glutamyl-tRNA(Gln) amidotransferase subunit C